jgi:hypothetical protein
MPATGQDAASAARALRTGLAAALRRRRLRDASRRVWQAAPAVGATGLVTAVLAWWMAWPPSTAIAVLLIGAVGLAVHVALALRRDPVSDAAAAAIDAAAGLDGELRSANWFATREHRDAWADEHVIRAASRL